jgi:hypothetical protein
MQNYINLQNKLRQELANRWVQYYAVDGLNAQKNSTLRFTPTTALQGAMFQVAKELDDLETILLTKNPNDTPAQAIERGKQIITPRFNKLVELHKQATKRGILGKDESLNKLLARHPELKNFINKYVTSRDSQEILLSLDPEPTKEAYETNLAKANLAEEYQSKEFKEIQDFLKMQKEKIKQNEDDEKERVDNTMRTVAYNFLGNDEKAYNADNERKKAQKQRTTDKKFTRTKQMAFNHDEQDDGNDDYYMNKDFQNFETSTEAHQDENRQRSKNRKKVKRNDVYRDVENDDDDNGYSIDDNDNVMNQTQINRKPLTKKDRQFFSGLIEEQKSKGVDINPNWTLEQERDLYEQDKKNEVLFQRDQRKEIKKLKEDRRIVGLYKDKKNQAVQNANEVRKKITDEMKLAEINQAYGYKKFQTLDEVYADVDAEVFSNDKKKKEEESKRQNQQGAVASEQKSKEKEEREKIMEKMFGKDGEGKKKIKQSQQNAKGKGASKVSFLPNGLSNY